MICFFNKELKTPTTRCRPQADAYPAEEISRSAGQITWSMGAVPVQKKDSKAAFEVLLKTVWANPHTVNIEDIQ